MCAFVCGVCVCVVCVFVWCVCVCVVCVCVCVCGVCVCVCVAMFISESHVNHWTCDIRGSLSRKFTQYGFCFVPCVVINRHCGLFRDVK